jgi:hypothetical protein
MTILLIYIPVEQYFIIYCCGNMFCLNGLQATKSPAGYKYHFSQRAIMVPINQPRG